MKDLVTQSLPYLKCPNCNKFGTFSLLETKSIICCSCHCQYSYSKGYIDFIPNYSGSDGLAQKTMESSLVVRVYEKYIRPNFTSLGTEVDYSGEETWLENVAKTQSPKVVLDLACGTGRYARWINEKYCPDIVFALDVSEPMLTKAIEMNKELGVENIICIRANSEDLPISSDIVDWINCFGALHLFENPEKAIREIGRITKGNGLFTFLTASKKDTSISLKYFQQIFSKVASFEFFALDKLNQILKHAGFSNLTTDIDGMLMMGYCTKLKT